MASFCFDIDGTICETEGANYPAATPILERIFIVDRLFEDGYKIMFFAARGSMTGIDWRDVTKNQLSLWGVKYHELLLGKPHADVYVDDKARQDSMFFCQKLG